jgi:hypothetical protein
MSRIDDATIDDLTALAEMFINGEHDMVVFGKAMKQVQSIPSIVSVQGLLAFLWTKKSRAIIRNRLNITDEKLLVLLELSKQNTSVTSLTLRSKQYPRFYSVVKELPSLTVLHIDSLVNYNAKLREYIHEGCLETLDIQLNGDKTSNTCDKFLLDLNTFPIKNLHVQVPYIRTTSELLASLQLNISRNEDDEDQNHEFLHKLMMMLQINRHIVALNIICPFYDGIIDWTTRLIRCNSTIKAIQFVIVDRSPTSDWDYRCLHRALRENTSLIALTYRTFSNVFLGTMFDAPRDSKLAKLARTLSEELRTNTTANLLAEKRVRLTRWTPIKLLIK